jgi:hypothetical protein
MANAEVRCGYKGRLQAEAALAHCFAQVDDIAPGTIPVATVPRVVNAERRVRATRRCCKEMVGACGHFVHSALSHLSPCTIDSACQVGKSVAFAVHSLVMLVNCALLCCRLLSHQILHSSTTLHAPEEDVMNLAFNNKERVMHHGCHSTCGMSQCMRERIQGLHIVRIHIVSRASDA